MFGFTQRQRENTGKVLLSLITVDAATLIAGNLFSQKGFLFPIFLLGCILFITLYILILLIDR